MNTTPSKGYAPKSYRARQVRVRALLVPHGDGFVEIYSERGEIDIHVEPLVWMPTAKGEACAQLLAESCMPVRFRELYAPGNLVTTFRIRKLRPSDLAESQGLLAILRALDSAKEERHIWIG